MNNTKIKKAISKVDNRTSKRKTGDLGEEIACKYLVNKGFSIVERNYLKKYGEIDIVAFKDNIYHFIEVKSVTRITSVAKQGSLDSFKPEDNVNKSKLRKMARVVEAYVLHKKLYDKEWVVDVLTVRMDMENRLARVEEFNNIPL